MVIFYVIKEIDSFLFQFCDIKNFTIFFKNLANLIDFPLEKLKNYWKMTNLSKQIFNGGHGEIIYTMLDVVTSVF